MSIEASIFPATKKQLREILAWLKQEQLEAGEGFYCNREIIIESQQVGELYCAVVCSKVVGFVVLGRKSLRASIAILEVKPQCRNQGIGKTLAVSVIERLFADGVESITVSCVPASSEQYWRSLGFLPESLQSKRSMWDAPKLLLRRSNQ